MSEESERAYGCLFCVTGKERAVANRVREACPMVRVITARQEKHKSVNGRKTKIETPLLPGYVFFEAPSDIEPTACFPKENLIRVLTTDHGVWQLEGEDARFARWLFQYDGLLGFSKAYKEGERIRIISGPLRDMEGQIRRIDKRGHSGQVMLEFNGRSVAVWLGFDLIDSLAKQ